MSSSAEEIKTLFEEARSLKVACPIHHKIYNDLPKPWIWLLAFASTLVALFGVCRFTQPSSPLIQLLDRTIEAPVTWDTLMTLQSGLNGHPRLSILTERLADQLLVQEVFYLPVESETWRRELLEARLSEGPALAR